MKKALKILLVMSMVGSMFVVGFAGNAAADSQSSHQWASSHVDQDQWVAQGNSNYQDDNYAVSASGSLYGDSESGDATAIQASYQSNKNSQNAWSNAQNSNWQKQGDDKKSRY